MNLLLTYLAKLLEYYVIKLVKKLKGYKIS